MSLFKKMLSAMTGGADRISVEEGRERVAGGALVVDVRSPGEYAGGHLPDAVNIPVSELSGRLAELPKDRALVLYCASGARSSRAAAFLRNAGYDVGDVGPMPNPAEWTA